MKRSEMVSIIIKHIANLKEDDIMYYSYEHAVFILDDLEKAGMQPPSREMDCGCCSVEGWEEE